MKQILLVMLIAFSSLLASSKEATDVSNTLNASAHIEPDIYSFGLFVFMTNSSEKTIINSLGIVDKTIRSLGLCYEGGRYSLYQNCRWEKDKRVCEGYKGEVGYQFFIQDPKMQNRVLQAIDELKSRMHKGFGFSIRYPHWEVSRSRRESVVQDLQLRLIDKAKTFGKKAGEKLSKQCHITSIDYTTRYFPVVRTLKSMTVKSDIQAPEPARTKQRVEVKAKVEYVCR
ncbi:SIMPL domain-containing protein [Nitratiruptor sp. SB155-2]|uniref:SIMPL domain-containing protein n=1 Tax=Nitratiruptor sp. (strain SB155-2) TaxID=387092 RepID=UPI0001586FB3|nr:SIMPL domain-containing protein [Nitratiruptor sp. SB155-2]BAF70808.1 hypothetical protein NIS_1702 [Nitratiruptor sp. SB155-2]